MKWIEPKNKCRDLKYWIQVQKTIEFTALIAGCESEQKVLELSNTLNLNPEVATAIYGHAKSSDCNQGT